jgi:hypothetical protein
VISLTEYFADRLYDHVQEIRDSAFLLLCSGQTRGSGFISDRRADIMRKYILDSILIITFLAALTGCGAGDAQVSSNGGNEQISINSNDPTPINAGQQTADTSTSLAWEAPTTYSDGSAFIPAGYKIYYGTSSGNYTQVVDAGNIMTYDISNLNLTPGTYYITVTSYDSMGQESGLSNEVAKTVV